MSLTLMCFHYYYPVMLERQSKRDRFSKQIACPRAFQSPVASAPFENEGYLFSVTQDFEVPVTKEKYNRIIYNQISISDLNIRPSVQGAPA